MIQHLTDFRADVAAFACRGRVTKRDYDTGLVPAVEAALELHDRVRLYYQIDPDFSGVDPGAMWQDFKVGVEHLRRGSGSPSSTTSTGYDTPFARSAS